jgi:hypothetical protein
MSEPAWLLMLAYACTPLCVLFLFIHPLFSMFLCIPTAGVYAGLFREKEQVTAWQDMHVKKIKRRVKHHRFFSNG